MRREFVEASAPGRKSQSYLRNIQRALPVLVFGSHQCSCENHSSSYLWC